MFKKSSARIKNFFKKITNSARKFILKMLLYILQIVGMTVIILIAILVIIAAILVTATRKTSNKYKNSMEYTNDVYSETSQR